MSKIRYSELFYSIQSEGRYTGTPSVFLRMFGCNFKCKNFNRHGDDLLPVTLKHNPEVMNVIKNIDNYEKLEDLPLVHTGCDSYPSVYPEFKRFSKDKTIDQVVDGILELLPHKIWVDEHLVITGGEPLLGWQRVYPELLGHRHMGSLKELTFETNGTQPLTDEFKEYLKLWGDRDHITFSVSAKLSNSGESREDAIKPNVVVDYQSVGFTYLKFVISNEDDLKEVLKTTTIYRDHGFTGPVYVMPCGGTTESFNLTYKEVADLALKNGLRYSDRLHIRLYGNEWST